MSGSRRNRRNNERRKNDKPVKKKENKGFWKNWPIFHAAHTLGAPTFLISILGIYLTVYASDEQKKELIDLWLLFKFTDEIQAYFVLVIIIAVAGAGIVSLIKNKKIRSLEDELERVTKERNDYQELFLNKTLKKSK